MNANPQEQHYETIHDAYAAHYYDHASNDYRRRFVMAPLLQGLDLNNCTVAELACGDGHNSVLLKEIFPSVRTEGFDLSPKACRQYELNTGLPAHKLDLTASAELESRFDAAFIIGGLHHCVADLPATLRNTAALLKPGAKFLMYEPSANFMLEPLRKAWYRADKYFDVETERALDHAELVAAADGRFKVERVFYIGGPAYFMILNSLVTRIPIKWKNGLAKPLFGVEAVWNKLPGRFAFPVFGAIWTRL